jgi:hypothetical protein
MKRPSRTRRPLACALLGALALPAAVAAQDPTGLGVRRARRFANQAIGGWVSEAGDRFGEALASGDFNGDGVDDLAIGIPGDNGLAGGPNDEGLVVVRYGALGAGLDGGALGPTVLRQLDSGGRDPAEEGDELGRALVACDLDDDGFDDLVVGVPYEGVAGTPNAGAVQVHFGASDGIHDLSDQFLPANGPGLVLPMQAGGELGWALACGDFDADGDDDLAIGLPHYDVGQSTDAGWVLVVPGSAAGLDPLQAEFHNQASVSTNSGEPNELFGHALAAGNFDGDPYADLAIGVPKEVAGGATWGMVHVVSGSSSGIGAQDAPEFGVSLLSDTWAGWSLAAGEVFGNGVDAPVAEAPLSAVFRSFEELPEAGYVLVGLGQGNQGSYLAMHLSEDDVVGPSATGDLFGWAVAVADFNADGYADVAASHPGESRGSRTTGAATGAVSVWMGRPQGDEVPGPPGAQFSPGFGGVPGQLQVGRRFGEALATGDFDADGAGDLAVGAPHEDHVPLIGSTVADVGAVYLLYGVRELHDDGFESASTGAWSADAP